MRALFLSITKKLSLTIAVLIIIAGVLVSLTHLVNPVLNNHRGELENWASQLLGMPVVIEKVDIAWRKYHPEIRLTHVTLLDKDTKLPNLQIKVIGISLSVVQSLLQQKPVPSGILIFGTDVNIKETAAGEYTVQGFPAFGTSTQPLPNETRFKDLVVLLYAQPEITLRDVDLHYTGFNGQKRYVTLFDLDLTNSYSEHLIFGKAILHQAIPTELSVAIKWFGDDTELSKLNANIYLYVSGLSLAQWLDGHSWSNWQVNQGLVSAKIWATWMAGQFTQVQTTMQGYDLILYSKMDKTNHKINRFSGNFGWKRQGENQVFAGDDLLIDLPAHLWPITHFYLSVAPDTSGKLMPKLINVGYADLYDVQSFLNSSAILPADIQTLLKALNLRGVIQNATATFASAWNDVGHTSLNVKVDQLHFAPWKRFPGVKNLSGNVAWDGKRGEFIIHSNRLTLNYDAIFARPIDIDQLTGGVEWSKDQSGNWKITIPTMQILNADLAANVHGTINVPTAGPLTTDISANFTMQQASHITRYLPQRIFDADLNKWLNQAFLSGEVLSANAVLRGVLAEFPFDKDNGLFQISGLVRNVDLRFAPDWPILKHVKGKLTFTNRRMEVDAEQATLFGIPIAKAHGEIPYLGNDKPQILIISADPIQTDFTHGLHFIHASPLEKTIGKMFSDIQITGPLTLKLGLTVPLKQPDDTQVNGEVVFTSAQMNLAPWRLALNDLTGRFQFTDNSATANNITGIIFGKPLTLNLTTINKNIQAAIATKLDIKDLEKWLKFPFSKVVSGVTDVKSKINFGFKTPLTIRLESNLLGVTVDLPDQYAKKANVVRNFTSDIILQEKQPLQMKLSYGDLFNAALVLNRRNGEFNLTAANLHLGSGPADWPKGTGLYITGDFDELDWTKIKKQIDQSGASANTSRHLPLREIKVNAKVLSLGGQRLTQLHLQAVPVQKNWNVMVHSEEAVGQIQVPMNFNPKGLINARFERLDLHSNPNSSNESALKFNVKSLPAISILADSVRYNDMPIGQVNFKAVPNANGLAIRNLSIDSPYMNLQAIGTWTAGGTRLQGSAAAANVSSWLNSMGVDAHNFVSSNGKLTFSLSWNDAPYALSLANLAGSASLEIGRGRIVDVGQASGAKMDIGRMLSIFSLQSIPRRLAFDFSDVFQKGYSFDSVRGDFTFRNGSAYTNDMRFDGPVARVGINGRIGLRNKDYDFTLNVTPYVTSSLPVAATLITGNPVIGLAAMAVNTVLSSGVSRVTTYHYAVSGPWDNPSWQSINAVNQ